MGTGWERRHRLDLVLEPKSLQRFVKPFQSAAKGFGWPTESDSEMLRAFKKIPRHNAGLKLFT
jgi:hypothetical protein